MVGVTPSCVEAVMANPMGRVCDKPHTDELQLGVHAMQDYERRARLLLSKEKRNRNLVIGGAAITNATRGLRYLGALDPVLVSVEYWAEHRGSAVRLAVTDTRGYYRHNKYDLIDLLAQHRAFNRRLSIGGRRRMREIVEYVLEEGDVFSAHTFGNSLELVQDSPGVKVGIRRDVHEPDSPPSMDGQTVKLGRGGTAVAIDSSAAAKKRITLVDIAPGVAEPAWEGYEYTQDAVDATTLSPSIWYAPGSRQGGSMGLSEVGLGEQYARHRRLLQLRIVGEILGGAVIVAENGKRI